MWKFKDQNEMKIYLKKKNEIHHIVRRPKWYFDIFLCSKFVKHKKWVSLHKVASGGRAAHRHQCRIACPLHGYEKPINAVGVSVTQKWVPLFPSILYFKFYLFIALPPKCQSQSTSPGSAIWIASEISRASTLTCPPLIGLKQLLREIRFLYK